MDSKRKTVATYNRNAKAFAEKFDTLGSRSSDIEEVFCLSGKENPRVLEIGCGNGRDAREICNRTDDYLGIDISEELIKIARENTLARKFKVADVEEFRFPNGIDVVFAFASLLHVNKESLQHVIKNVHESLNKGGLFRISLKYAQSYIEITKQDDLGERTFYLYSKEDIADIAKGFSFVKNELNEINKQIWLEILLAKK